MASIVELREMSNEKIEDKLESARQELFNLRFQHASARLEDVSRMRTVRREISQYETVLNMRKLAIERAVQDPAIASVLKDKNWSGEASFDYEKSAWQVTFVDENDNEIESIDVNLNKKQPRGRKAYRRAQ